MKTDTVYLTFPVPLAIEVRGADSLAEAYSAIQPENFRDAIMNALARMDDEQVQTLADGCRPSAAPVEFVEEIQ